MKPLFGFIRVFGLMILLSQQVTCNVLPVAGRELQKKDTGNINQSRLSGVILSGCILYSGTMTGLYTLWYKDYPMSSFHFFNDLNEWQEVDKLGHMTTGYHAGKIGYEALRWSGVGRNKAVLWGASAGMVFLTSIEIMDGFSAQWGFSWPDFASNTIGTALFVGQQLGWNEQRFRLKWSFHQTVFSRYRPDLLGENLVQNLLKDYNGHTYWLCVNPAGFLAQNSKVPAWLDLAIGYNADGMTGAESNPVVHAENILPDFERNHRFYLSPDINLSKIKTRSRTLHFILETIDFIKIPLPALELNEKGRVILHRIYF